MDRATAQALVDSGVAAVVNASPMISGRYANLGPEVLAQAGVLLLDRVEGAPAIRDGATVRIHDGVVHVGEDAVASGRETGPATIADEMDGRPPRHGHPARDLHPQQHRVPAPRAGRAAARDRAAPPRHRIDGRAVVVVVAGHEHRAELDAIRSFIREQDPVLIGVDRGADALLDAGHKPDIVVLGDGLADADQPSAKALRGARDVVVRVDRGGRMHREQLERMGIRPLGLESSATTEDAALLLAEAGDARLVVGVGMHASLDEFLDRQRPGLASTYLTRLKVGDRLVDARAVPALYSGRVRPRHLFLVLLAGLVARGRGHRRHARWARSGPTSSPGSSPT